ncbi:DUF2309 domain-containing protein [Calycomorphotria hydatis]|uniref:DUF2309 domain-containing protein n=1 Tax=Calycomorphotria hydatis TaxID=2528027 RepID=UPI001E407403|nr:DUF2309 domain-containing protein [Calycomorphotria hydatis]
MQHLIEHAAHYLPSQGPITVFVHHNTLHAFEDLYFDEGVQEGGRLLGCHAYMPEDYYRRGLKTGRIRVEDLDATLQEDLGDEADRLVAIFCTRYSLRLAMLEHPLYFAEGHELRWVVGESDALRRFRGEVTDQKRRELISSTRKSVLLASGDKAPPEERETLAKVVESFRHGKPENWNDRTWEAFVLNYLWQVCCDGVESALENTDSVDCQPQHAPRHRDILFEETGEDSDLLVHETLIRYCAAFLDQGFADWEIPFRNEGFFNCFLKQHSISFASPDRWTSMLRHESKRLLEANVSPLESIQESLNLLEISPAECETFITQSLLALRGWAGMVWQMETNAEWAPRPAPRGSLVEFLAIRLMLDRVALKHISRDAQYELGSLSDLRAKFRSPNITPPNHIEERAFTIFQLAQVLGWNPHDLHSLRREQWAVLLREVHAFDALERRRIFHRAFERKYRNAVLDAIIAHNRPPEAEAKSIESDSEVPFQLVTCIDDREESFRRHIEEVEPNCETFGFAGFYAAAMYFRGCGQAHFKPLCPVNVKPNRYVVEEPLYSMADLERRKSLARQRIGQINVFAHRGSRTLLGGIFTAVGGSLAAFPLVGRVLFPGTMSVLRRRIGKIVEPLASRLRIEFVQDGPDPYGFTIEEMANIVKSVLRSIGISKRWSPLVIILGHGSTSLNNPHESAYNCGACAGSQGGPNARAFALMANDYRVRQLLQERGLKIPASTVFVGGYHDTTNESVDFADLDRLPVTHRERFESMVQIIREARERNAHERCRRFESAPLSLSTSDALRHVENRPEDLSQARPEYNHATNALCLVGRREWSRNLFIDRRTFLASYDPHQDDEKGATLEEILRPAIPVCAGISLEYYFSTVDVEGYGCGSKLPHNITSLLGVMTGSASDLRPGLSAQMTEIHEPMRILFVVESTQEAMQRIIENNPAIARLVQGEWVQLAIYDGTTNQIYRFVRDKFVLYAPHETKIPTVTTSMEWYGGNRDHLGFASIVPRKGGT